MTAGDYSRRRAYVVQARKGTFPKALNQFLVFAVQWLVGEKPNRASNKEGGGHTQTGNRKCGNRECPIASYHPETYSHHTNSGFGWLRNRGFPPNGPAKLPGRLQQLAT